ncbi:MAG: class I SAM-dependent methyltransferase [Acidiferrobacterales bacterium]
MTLISRDTKAQLRIAVMGHDENPVLDAQARTLAQQFGLDFIAEPVADVDLVLAYGEDGLNLRDLRDHRTRPVCIDFTKIDIRPHSANLSRRQPLARAMGKKNTSIIDATAGLGQDAFLLTAMGFQAIAVERNAVLAALLQDALSRAQQNSIVEKVLAGRLSFIYGDARKIVPALDPADVIYLDPMFPPRRSKSALARKEMRILRDLVGEDADAGQLFEMAHAHARNRVVVKRPQHAKPLIPGPDFALVGKLVRYDVYLTHATKSDECFNV